MPKNYCRRPRNQSVKLQVNVAFHQLPALYPCSSSMLVNLHWHSEKISLITKSKLYTQSGMSKRANSLFLRLPTAIQAPAPSLFPISCSPVHIFFLQPAVNSRLERTISLVNLFRGALSAGGIQPLRRLRREGSPERLSRS